MIMDIAAIGLIEDEDILLDLASLALSQLDHENADIAHYLDMLEDIEDRVCAEGRSAGRTGRGAFARSARRTGVRWRR
jgi:hypothetical protein